ncbi:MAG: double-strand break repair helicase AddA, partial [Pseudomonadota bacterium]
IWKTVSLLSRPDIRDWVRFRLDQGIDHVLVDEAQDTSPAQWQIINAVTEDFHAGEGNSLKDRTHFVVGDEKQSIYSFQGADPREFSVQQKRLRKNVLAAGKDFKNARLDLSFRSTEDVLHAVDEVFRNAENARGLMEDGNPPPHDAIRKRDAGEVQVWPLFVKQKQEERANWLDPIDRDGPNDPALQLARRISATVKDWVDNQPSGIDEPLTYGDILVLVRKRDRFIPALTRTMKDDGIPVAGADRLKLLEHIAVEDLLSAGRFVLLPEDDLNLACLLKSMFFDISDPELFDLSHKRGGQSLYDRICELADEVGDDKQVTAKSLKEMLEELQEKARQSGPFEFYAWLLGAKGGRRKILARLGMEAEEVIDAFVDQTIGFVRDGGIGLEGFIQQLTKANPEIKREQELGRDEVRILTVHAAKGLEARVVFLVDSCGKPWNANHRPKVMTLDAPQTPFVWVPNSQDQTPVTEAMTLRAQADAEAEYRRLLYVGMTRAADRLVVCGYRGIREPDYPHWHSMVHKSLVETSTLIANEAGEEIGFRWVKEVRSETDTGTAKPKAPEKQKIYCPDWLFSKVEAEPPLPRPLTPSGAYALIDEALKENRRPVFEEAADGQQDGDHALEFGSVVHRLLEVLPDLDAGIRQTRADEFLLARCRHWSEDERVRVLRMVEKLLTSSEFGFLFEAGSKSEVPVVGSLVTRSGTRLVSGQIDRLLVSESGVLIADYKTNRIVPEHFDQVPADYIAQMSLYRHLMQEVYPDHDVICGLLWTSLPEFMPLPPEILDEALDSIKNG